METSFNLIESCFCPEVHCSTPAVDGYEISNLLKPSSTLSACGFLAESFIKPPVDIKFRFPCNVNLDRILIDSKVGAQRSTGFEFYSHAANLKFQNAKEDLQLIASSSADTRVLSCIGKGTCMDSHMFCFSNNRFQRYFVSSKVIPVMQRVSSINHQSESRIRTFNLNSRSDDNLCRVTDLTIRIRSVARSSVVALRRIEILGYPSKEVPHVYLRELIRLRPTSNITDEDVDDNLDNANDPSKVSAVESQSQLPLKRRQVSEENVEIPEDFLDAITHDIMTIPMLLPSGYNIDQSTLEKHQEEQANWGRQPNDPFTFKTFSNESKPLVNAALKVRIDEFILQNPALTITKQTLGRADRYNVRIATSSKLIRSTNTTEQDAAIRPNAVSNASKNCNQECITQEPKTKRVKLESKPAIDSQNETHPSNSHTKIMVENYTAGNNPSNDRTHTLALSLNNALNTVLEGLPGFEKNSSKGLEKGNSSLAQQCIFCETPKNVQCYRLKCEHLICRTCLLKKTTGAIFCNTCDRGSEKHEIIKVHL